MAKLILALVLFVTAALDLFVLNSRLADWVGLGAILLSVLTVASYWRRGSANG